MKDFKLKRTLLLAASLLLVSLGAFAEATAEYRVKAGFLYNFIAFTEWPATVGSPLTLCVYGASPLVTNWMRCRAKTLAGAAWPYGRRASSSN